jgi:hypothetical protein
MLGKKMSLRFLIGILAVAILFAVFIPVTALMSGSASDREKVGAVASHPPVDAQTRSTPDVVRMLGPVSEDRDLKDLPHIPPTKREEAAEPRLRRHPLNKGKDPVKSDPYPAVDDRDLLVPAAMPTPLSTFAGINSSQSACGCLPPDTNGDVGPNHYIQAVNSRIKILDKAGNQLLAPTTYNSFFSGLGGSTPCGSNQNDGDGVVFYDHIADRWIVSDFAFPGFPGSSFYQCIGVSKTNDPVSGGWWLYSVQTDPSNPNFLGDYPKFGLWPDAYYMTANMFSNNTTFNGVRVYAFDRNAMINGGPADTIAFTIAPADLGDQYSLLPATFRTGSSPPAGQPEYFMDINSSATAGTLESQVFVRRFHVDFATPANSTFGVGSAHLPDATILVNPFVDAYTSTTSNIVPNGTTTTSQYLDTLGDKLMFPLAYQNLNGTESIYAAHTINNNQNGTGPTAIRWYQFNMTGNTIPAVPAQQQTFNNNADGLWRDMPSINVDAQGNLAIGYTASSATVNPGIRYAGRLATDPPGDLAQGEAVLIDGGGHQTSGSGRWGDYSSMFLDPTDNCTFWHTNEYYSATGGASWNTRIGSFKYPGCTAVATPAISGSVTYGNAIGAPTPPRPVANVLIGGAGSQNVSGTTGSLGTYSLTGFGSGSYTMTPSKTGGDNGAISSFDCGRIAQYVTGNTTFTPAQLTVADVSGTGGVSSFDAALISRYVASLGSPTGSTGTWIFNPASYTQASVTGNTTEDYSALLMGEVSGNWTNGASRSARVQGPERSIEIAAPAVRSAGKNEVIVPISVDRIADKGIISYEFDLHYDPSVIQPQPGVFDLTGTVSRGLAVVTNVAEPGVLRVVVYGAMPIEKNGVLLKIRFSAVGTEGSTSPLSFERIVFNEDEVPLAASGEVKISAN